jgi:hypothetical protein
VTEIVVTAAALDVTAKDVADRFVVRAALAVRERGRSFEAKQRRLKRPGAVRIRPEDRGLADKVAEAALEALASEVRGIDRIVDCANANRLPLLRRQEGVVAVDRAGVAEVARRRDLRVGVVVHEHGFDIRMRARCDLVIGEGAERVALVRPLEVVVRREVERGRPRHELVAVDLEVSDVGQERAGRRGTRAAAAEGAVRLRSERAVRIVTRRFQHRILVAVGRIGDDMATAVVERSAEHARNILRPTVHAVAVRRKEPAGRVGREDLRIRVVVVLEHARLAVDAEAGERRVEDEVDNAGDGVRTVDRRGAAREDVDPLDQLVRNEVDVGDRVAGVARLKPLAVDQDEVALRAEAAKVNRGRAAGAVGDVRTLRREHLRQRVDQVFRTAGARKLHFLAADGGHRARRFQVRLRNARTRNDDFLRAGRRRALRIGARYASADLR